MCTIRTGKLDANASSPGAKYTFFTCSKDALLVDTYAFDGDAIIINGNGVLGYTRKFSGKFNAYQRTYVLMNFEYDYEFLELSLNKHLPKSIREEAIGGAMPYIKLQTLTELNILIPKNKEQVRLKFFFGNLDNLITLHQRA